MRRFIASIMILICVVSLYPEVAKSEKATLSNINSMYSCLSMYGFQVDKNEYTNISSVGLIKNKYRSNSGELFFIMVTRVMIIRSKYSSSQNYIDRVLTYTELEPQKMKKSPVGTLNDGEFKSYPKDLTVYCQYPKKQGVEFEGSIPKSVAGSYNTDKNTSLGLNVGTSGIGISLNFGCSESTLKKALTVVNNSSLGNNYSKIKFTYNPGKTNKITSNMKDYIQTTTEQITTQAVTSKVKNYIIDMNFVLNVSYTRYKKNDFLWFDTERVLDEYSWTLTNVRRITTAF